MARKNELQTWITAKRIKDSGLKLKKVFVDKLDEPVETNTLRLWGVSETHFDNIPFANLSKLLKIKETILIEDYWRVRRENGYMREPLDSESKEQLMKVIADCREQNVLLNTKSSNKKSPHRLSETIIDGLEKGLMDSIIEEFQSTLLIDIKAANKIQLGLIRRFISVFTSATVIMESKYTEAGKHKLIGDTPVWQICLFIDKSINHDFTSRLQIANEEILEEACIKHFQLSNKAVGNDEVDAFYDLVSHLNERFRPNGPVPPSNKDNETEFNRYCIKLDSYLKATNLIDKHGFCIVNESYPDSLLIMLVNRFKNLRIFETEDSEKKSTLCRVSHFDLGEWLIVYIGEILKREEALETSTLMEERDSRINLEKETKENNVRDIKVHIENKPSFVNKPIFNQNNAPQWQQFAQDFDALKQNIQENKENPDYRDLKNAVRDIQEHIEEKGSLPKESKSWLEKSFSAISKTNSTWALTEKTIKAIALLNGAGLA